MKYLLLIPLFCATVLGQGWPSDVAFMAQQAQFGPSLAVIGFKPLGTNSTTTGATSYATLATYQVDVGGIAIAIVQNSKAAAPDTNTWSGNGLTWTRLYTTNYSTDGERLTVYYSTPSNNVSAVTTGTADFAGQTQTGCSIYVCEFTNVAASSIIVQTAKATNATANASVTLASLDASGRNAALCCFGNVAGNGANFGTPKAGWTEDQDSGYNTPASGLYVMHRLATTDNAPSVTSSAEQWAGIAIEIKVGTP